MADRGVHADSALVRRCLAGDADAWRELVERHRPGMVDLARRIAPAAAHDVVDAVIADLWQRGKLQRYEGRSSLATWLGAVVIHAALNARRSLRSTPEVAEGREYDEPVAASDENAADAASLSGILSDAIASLPDEQKLLVLLHYEQGLSLDRASVLLGRSKSTLSRTLHQARAQIRATADRLARERLRTTLDALREGTDLGRLDLDLRAACGPRHKLGRSVSN